MSEAIGVDSQKFPPIFKVIQPLRGAAILLVVLAHAVISMLAAEVSLTPEGSLFTVGNGFWQLSSVWKSIVLEICRCAVPLFLFLSGYHMLMTSRNWKTIWISCKKLLMPMVFWSLITWGLTWTTGKGGWSISIFFVKLFTGTTQLGYFFIILITQYYILSKLLIPLIKKKPNKTLIAVIAIQLCVHAYDYIFLLSQLGILTSSEWILKFKAFPEFLFPRFLVSFSLGIWASVYNQRFKAIIANKFGWITIITIITMLILILERGLIYGYSRKILVMSYFNATSISWVEWKISTALWTIASLFWIFGFFLRYVPIKKFFVLIGKNSFQILLLHGMVIILTKRIMYKYFSQLQFYGFTGTFILLIIGVFIPVLMAKLIQKHFSPVVRMLVLGG